MRYFSMRYGNRLKLHTLRKHPYPGESSLLRALSWEVDVPYQQNRELSQSRNNLHPGHTGILLKLVSLNHPHLTRQTITALLPRILAGNYQTNIEI